MIQDLRDKLFQFEPLAKHWELISVMLLVIAVYVYLEYWVGFEIRKESKSWIIQLYNSWVNEFIFWRARKIANSKARASGHKRHYVVPVNGQMMILRSDAIARFNRKVKKLERIQINELLERAYYITDGRKKKAA